MQYKELKDKAKKLGLRVTKNVGGKRIKLSAKELRSKITMNFENSVKNAQKVIRICQTIVAPTQSQQASGRAPIPPPPPPPPKKPVLNNKRAKLIAELKANLKKRGLSK
ncbi:hypothetical protein MpV1_194 [Micromonas sp. RCC1109 virus MpV1]|jgi:hypothetical protein|uniref:hypothetical protein n=1 Tax=Micromonas sp. RCC1109 virus MpV1 TaxID=880161 RepID=UPI0001EF44DB|nr:hypothetical protein MpV1_194 [Micromonas sp. RCC1109 virus MpV1]ADQ91117.1 hypothetical protein MpV1_194 [Micromonas sp. RCC1109 virus MpV1]